MSAKSKQSAFKLSQMDEATRFSLEQKELFEQGDRMVTPEEQQSISDSASKVTQLRNDLDAESARAAEAEVGNANDIAAEEQRAKAKEQELQSDLTAETQRATTKEQLIESDVTNIKAVIPGQASSQNQLADKNFVNSSIQTNTADYISNNGVPFNSLAALQAYTGKHDVNDYAFVVGQDAAGNTTYTRYKFTAEGIWAEEYVLNNSSFTAAQWAAIESGITSGDKTKLDALPTKAQLDTLFAAKQDVINDLATIRSGAGKGATAYQKPAGGIPAEDLTPGVQTSLGNADTALSNTTQLRQDLTAETQRATTKEQLIESDVTNIKAVIPGQASSQNQLADKNFVNSSIQTNTADYISNNGVPFNSLAALQAYTGKHDVNDYAFVVGQDAAGNTTYTRYKFTAEGIWAEEYVLNNSSFTAAQWAAIESGITSGDKAKLDALPTKAQLDTLFAAKQDVISDLATIRSGAGKGATAYQKPAGGIPAEDLTPGVQTSLGEITPLQNRIFFVEKSFGKYDGQREIVLSQAKEGKYVNTDGGETTASGYGISAPVALNAGDILLIPSAQAVPASVSVVARMVDRTYQKVIAYIYTYREDYPELPATATADYNTSLVYTAVYDESGDTPVLTGWTRAGQTYATLPATREVSEQFYEPLVRQAVSAMPSTGYYIYLCPSAMTVVISGLTATVAGGTALVVGWGIFKNITTNFVGAPGQSVLAQAFAVLFAAIDGLRAQLENLGETKAISIDFEEIPKLCGQPWVIKGNGAPAAPVVPTMIGQEYLDVNNKKCYKAFSITNSVSDWVLMN